MTSGLRSLAFAIVGMLVVIAAVEASSYKPQFEAFKQRFNRKYATPAEHDRRFDIFVQNMIIAAGHQARNPFATFGVNEYSDYSAEEFKVFHNAEKYFAAAKNAVKNPPPAAMYAAAAGTSIDWRTKGAVTPIKNQGQCGSCWTFSTTGNIEGQWFLAGNPLTSLSEQELVSCDTTGNACQGGTPDIAFEWLVSSRSGYIVTEASYPYVSGNGNVPACSMRNRVVGARISGHYDIPSSETTMANYVYQHGPVSIGVDGTSFQTYTGGIVTNCINNQLDHAVLIVGFDDTHNPPYWIVKNQWGTSWGEAGYIRLEKGTNQCGMNENPSTSLVAKNPSHTPIPQPPPSSGSSASSGSVPSSSSTAAPSSSSSSGF